MTNTQPIRFTRGVPAKESYPTGELISSVTVALEEYGPDILGYGTSMGFTPLREWLAEKYGADIPLDELLGLIAFDCPFREGPHRRRGNQYVPKCHARFVDLEAPPRPPDLPPALRAFSVVKGGKA